MHRPNVETAKLEGSFIMREGGSKQRQRERGRTLHIQGYRRSIQDQSSALQSPS